MYPWRYPGRVPIHQWVVSKSVRMLYKNPTSGYITSEMVHIIKKGQSQFFIVAKKIRQLSKTTYTCLARAISARIDKLDAQTSDGASNNNAVELQISEDSSLNKLMNKILTIDGDLSSAALEESPIDMNKHF